MNQIGSSLSARVSPEENSAALSRRRRCSSSAAPSLCAAKDSCGELLRHRCNGHCSKGSASSTPPASPIPSAPTPDFDRSSVELHKIRPPAPSSVSSRFRDSCDAGGELPASTRNSL
uniref:Uncharacterized protein n=1 Tax=Kalanchoe fedtschenkoi TaxID=63787 RepID=A0A7N0VDG4_KALFE